MLKPGAPHLIRAENGLQIPEQIVDEFVQCSEYLFGWSLRMSHSADHPCSSDFKLPFVTSDPPISVPLKQIGESYNAPPLSDPMDPETYPMLRKLVKKHVSNPFNFAELEKLEPSTSTRSKVQVGRQSVLAQKVLRPDLAIKVVE